jgi:outer membrane protein TolC
MNSSRASVPGAIALCLLGACASVDSGSTPATTVGARDRVRALDTAGRWTRPDAETVVEPEWWRIFGDEELSRLIDQAIADNIDLRILTYRIDQAALGVRSARQSGLPQFSADIGGSASFQSLGALSRTTKQYDGGINVGWEADIWGKLRQQTAATQAEVRATEADWRAGYLILIREVASSYFQLRAFEEQMEIHTRALGWAREALQVFERQLAHGLITRDNSTS